jgi:hypothetical protein
MQKTPNPARLPLLALGTGAVLVVLGHALSTPMVDSAHAYVTRFAANRSEHVAGLLLTGIGAFLLVPGAAGILRVLDGRSRLARVGCTIGGIGAAALGAGDVLVACSIGTVVGKGPDLAARYYEAMNHSSLGPLPFQFAPLFVVGFVLLGISLVRLGGAVRWPAAVLIVGTVLLPISGSGGASAALTLTPLAIGFATVAWTLSRWPQSGSAVVLPAVPAIEAV